MCRGFTVLSKVSQMVAALPSSPATPSRVFSWKNHVKHGLRSVLHYDILAGLLMIKLNDPLVELLQSQHATGR
jgi:hypothetical protein